MFSLFSFFKKRSGGDISSYKFKPDQQDLFDALCSCHLGDRSRYFTKLKKLAETFSEEPLFFLFAGDIVRDSNKDKALEIHREILFRPNTSGALRARVLEHIGRDYIAMNQPKKAISVLKEAVKLADLPNADLMLSEIYEGEANFDEALSELEKYQNLTKGASPHQVQRLCARVVNFLLLAETKQQKEVVRWLEIFSKKSGDPNQSLAAEMMTAVTNGKTAKVQSALENLVRIDDGFEILGRTMLLNYADGADINYGVEGRYKEVFHLLFNKNLKASNQLENVSPNALVSYKLLLRNKAEGGLELLDKAIPDQSLFVCRECGKPVSLLSPVCPACQKITGRKFTIMK